MSLTSVKMTIFIILIIVIMIRILFSKKYDRSYGNDYEIFVEKY